MPSADRASVIVYGAVEGTLDEAVLRRIVEHVGASAGPIYGRQGKGRIRKDINGYNSVARHSPWFVLIDLNSEADCPPALRSVWLPQPSRHMCFRVAVRSIEAWLLADRVRAARLLSVAANLLPQHPDHLDNPKRSFIEAASQSHRRTIREELVPRVESGRREGPLYTARLIQFVGDVDGGWRPDVAAESSPSLARCLAALRECVDEFRLP